MSNNILNMNERASFAELVEAMKSHALPDNAYVKVGVNPDGSENTMLAPVFKYAIPKGKKESIQVNDKNVAQILFDIQSATGAKNKIDMYIARKVYELSKYDNVIKNMNFDSAIDLYSTVFGVSVDKASKALRLGKYFIVGDDISNISFVPVVPANWTMSHLQEVLQYLPKDANGDVDEAKVIPAFTEWLQSGVIADGMTTKTIRSAMKSLLPEGTTATGRKSRVAKSDSRSDNETSDRSDVDVSVIDRLNDMPVDARVGHALNALDVLKAVFPTFNLDEETASLIEDSISIMRDIAHKQIKA